MNDKVISWLWLPDNGCLSYPPYTKVEVGQTLTAEGPLEIYKNGIHASLRALEALQYAEGAIVCQVELSGEILESHNLLCAQHCKVLTMADATTVLHEFGCLCAEQALLREREAGREPDPRSWAAIEVKRKWLRGEATDKKLEAAWDAARNAVYATAGNMNWNAAGAAALSAAGDLACNVACDAARDAACSAANNAACGTASDDATWDMIWDVAWDVAWTTQNAKLEEMLHVLLEEGEGNA
jgi:hypothetical protein